MKCADCAYCWKDESDDFPCCHFEGYIAPCEYEEEDTYYNDD